ncbi:MAG: (d)CMP kinase [Clostridia bacterium]|nr:(d)CMP kinase [Clostridia bacterium]
MVRIAIDGPGGAGKSTLAKAVAKQLGIIYVDTGALYRTIGLYMLRHGISPRDEAAVSAALHDFTLELRFSEGKQVILLDGLDVGDTIRAPEVSMAASDVSAIGAVRQYLLDMQRNTAKTNSVIMDGRDIGTVILPDAEVKIFLTASPEARARRRHLELLARGKEVSYDDVYREMVERDRNDSTRAIAPCVPAEDAVLLDNSDMTFEETVYKVIEIIKKNGKSKVKKNSYMRTWAVVAAPIRFFNRIKVIGLENIPESGGYMLAANHIAAKDVFLIGASCRRQIRFIAKKELFKIPIVGPIMRSFGAVKLDRGGNDVAAIRASIELIKEGNLVMIFPQGHRNPGVEPATTELKSGAGLIAHRAGCDVIPVCLRTKKHRYSLFRKTEVIFGKPIPHAELGLTHGGGDEYRKATEYIFARILSLGGFAPLPTSSESKGDN